QPRENRAGARSGGAARARKCSGGSSRSSQELVRPLASRGALTYRAARWIATRVAREGSLPEPTMLWPFNHFRKPRTPLRGTIEAIYGMIVTQSREPLFYRDLGVPDTVNGRFDLLLLHLWLFLRRLQSADDGTALSQGLFDHFCNDMDDNLREMGVGDLTVPKRMQAFGEAFYGRTAAYDLALTEGREALAQALCKNILNGENLAQARRLAAYAEAAMAALDGSDEAELLTGSCRFPSPVQLGADRTDLRGDAGRDRERHRRTDRSDLRAAGADPANGCAGRRGPGKRPGERRRNPGPARADRERCHRPRQACHRRAVSRRRSIS